MMESLLVPKVSGERLGEVLLAFYRAPFSVLMLERMVSGIADRYC